MRGSCHTARNVCRCSSCSATARAPSDARVDEPEVAMLIKLRSAAGRVSKITITILIAYMSLAIVFEAGLYVTASIIRHHALSAEEFEQAIDNFMARMEGR